MLGNIYPYQLGTLLSEWSIPTHMDMALAGLDVDP